ncbi:MAG TPA: M24 family metallopeptidase, partial [Rubricoccaceae bacterium]
MTEVHTKLALVRGALDRHGLDAVRLRGVDWFAWATGGGDSAVLQTSETGVAEVLVTPTEALVLTDAIEAPRMRDEVVPPEFTVWGHPWQTPEGREAFVREAAPGGAVASDRPAGEEGGLPADLVRAKRRLLPDEGDRYRELGRDAAEAMTATLAAARPDWTERDLAAHGAAALWSRGVRPDLILVGGADRVARFRHPLPTDTRLGDRAMLVFCARRHGLVASLTRWVYFREPTRDEARLDRDVRDVEAAAFQRSRP